MSTLFLYSIAFQSLHSSFHLKKTWHLSRLTNESQHNILSSDDWFQCLASALSYFFFQTKIYFYTSLSCFHLRCASSFHLFVFFVFNMYVLWWNYPRNQLDDSTRYECKLYNDISLVCCVHHWAMLELLYICFPFAALFVARLSFIFYLSLLNGVCVCVCVCWLLYLLFLAFLLFGPFHFVLFISFYFISMSFCSKMKAIYLYTRLNSWEWKPYCCEFFK